MNEASITEEQIAVLRLARSTEVGAITFHNLLERFGSAKAALDALPGLAARGGRASQIRLCSQDAALAEIEAAAKIGARLLAWGEAGYPELLAATEGAPPVLFVRGRIDCLAAPSIAMVGARNASANGRKLAMALAAGLGGRGHIIVSGLARGIDAAAHNGALETGTIAVIAGGIDQIYPQEHASLYGAIAETGAVLSEMPFGHVARANDFPRRNRIIAGLARGTIVVEAAERSGSLITARLAGEFGREVFAIPGSPLDARCRGTNRLLKEGATLIETADDVLDALPEMPRAPVKVLSDPPRPMDRRTPSAPRTRPESSLSTEPKGDATLLSSTLLELLGPSPISIDDLVRQTGASAADIHAALFDLELAGLTIRHPGQSVSRISE